jgi:hypothetical protein
MSWINSNESERRPWNSAGPRILWGVFAIFLAAGAFWMWHQTRKGPHVVHASTCDASVISGTYGYAIQGFFFDSGGNLQVYSSAGAFVLDGAGNLVGKETDAASGAVSRAAVITGTYTVNSDCSGSFTTNSPTVGGPFTYDFAITDSGNGLQMVESDQGTNITGSARKL